jgi:hypothetical protein
MELDNMRLFFDNTKRPKRIAKNLQDEFQARGFDYALTSCQELLARMTGYEDWYQLRVICEQRPEPSQHDNNVEPEIVLLRHKQYVSAMIDSGIDQSVAIDIVTSVAPTGVRHRSVQPEE